MSAYDDRACNGVDVEVFFPLDTDRRGVALAKAVCADCPWTTGCLEAAMEIETSGRAQRYGVYAGLTPRQRADLQRRRDKEADA